MTLALTRADKRRCRRRSRYALRSAIADEGRRRAESAGSWSDVVFARTCSCGLAIGEDVGIAWSTRADSAYPVGVATCGSVWACPVCSAKIRATRTADVEHLAAWHAANGGRLIMVTLTLPHDNTDRLDWLVSGLVEAWRVVQRDREWRRVRKGLVGLTRSLEVTHGFTGAGVGNGWHPHLHLLLLVPDELVASDLLDLRTEVELLLLDLWPEAVVGELGEAHRPSLDRGIDVRWIDAAAAQYVTKIAQEVTLGDLKSGARSVWSLPARGQWDRWAEFCTAMKGRASVQWSRGLRAACGLGVELSDEERCALDLEDGLVVARLERRYWNRLVVGGGVPAFLEGIEARCRAVRAKAPPPGGSGAFAAVA